MAGGKAVALESSEFRRTELLFRQLEQHLAPQTLAAGKVPGTVHVDRADKPSSALAQIGRRFYLAGNAGNDDFNQALRRLFLEEIYPSALVSGEEAFTLYYGTPEWEPAIEEILRGKDPLQGERHYYRLAALGGGWREGLQKGWQLRRVDQGLLAEGLQNQDALEEEICSEAPSVEYFLENCFGFALLVESEIAGWCLSEYNLGERCEVGIETVEGHRRQGIATLTASALAEYVLAHGIREIGWHCWASNQPSVATALAVGFRQAGSYRAYYGWFDPVVNQAVHGNRCFEREEYAEAGAWYERAVAAGEGPAWIYWNAACAKARAGATGAALGFLQQAVARGLGDKERIRQSRHLQSLQGTERWRELMASLADGEGERNS